MTTPYLGIDVSKDSIDVAIYHSDDNRNEHYRHANFSNNKDGFRRLLKWLKKHKAQRCHAALEATGRYGELLAEYLYEKKHPVSILNPASIKKYRESRIGRNKTDREDAALIAHYCATQTPHLWQPPAPHIRELQEMSRRLDALKTSRTRERNRLQSGLRSDVVIIDVEANIAFLNQQVKLLEQAIQDHIDRHPDLSEQVDLLRSIPSIGTVTAVGIISEVPDVSRFNSASQMAAYAGLTPSHKHSGRDNYSNGKLLKIGNRRLRSLFFMPQKTARRCNPIIAKLVERLQKANKQPKTIRGAIMRKLCVLAYGVLKTKTPFDPNYVNPQVAA